MQIIFESFINSLFFGAFILIFLVSYLLLQPFKMHRSRRYSTFFLKTSFLVYLLHFLFFVYMLLFAENNVLTPEDPRQVHVNLLFVILAFLVPNTGIVIRRKVKNRVNYNLFLGTLNICITLYLYFVLMTNNWFMVAD